MIGEREGEVVKGMECAGNEREVLEARVRKLLFLACGVATDKNRRVVPCRALRGLGAFGQGAWDDRGM